MTNPALAPAPHTPAIARRPIRRANAADEGDDFIAHGVAMLAGLPADARELKFALIVAAYRRALAKRLDAIDAASGGAVGRA